MATAPDRRTKIVCTLGPASREEAQIEALMQAGMDVARINFSHGTQPEHAVTIARVRAVAERLQRPVAILQDLQGPKIRTGALAGGGPVTLRDGQRFRISTTETLGTDQGVSTTYAALPHDVRPGDTILLSDGAIELRVRKASGDTVTCDIVHGGTLAEHQGINLPGVAVSAPALTDKDRADLLFGLQQGVDYVALSFVRRPEDLIEARRLITEAGTAATTPPLIAKLEKPEAVARLDEILAVADGVMVARGDLGVELPLERVPMIQKQIIARANALGLPVITATQMLESMLHAPRPTRAEASDVANAILDGTDAVMLSGETAVGAYSVEAVQVMARIAHETEQQRRSALHLAGALPPPPVTHATLAHAVSAAAHTLADQAQAPLIAVFTRSGASAQVISRERPAARIVAYTPSEAVYRRLALWWGVTPCRSELQGDSEALLAWVEAHLRASGLAEDGAYIVVMGGMPLAGRASTNFLRVHKLGAST